MRTKVRDWRIYVDFAQVLIAIARPLYALDPIGVDLDQSAPFSPARMPIWFSSVTPQSWQGSRNSLCRLGTRCENTRVRPEVRRPGSPHEPTPSSCLSQLSRTKPTEVEWFGGPV